MDGTRTSILVTGGTGNIGAWITRRLVEGGFLVVVYDLKPDLTYLKDISDSMKVIEGDVTDFSRLDAALRENKVRTVIHLAKYLGVRCEENPRRAVEVNVMGTTNVIDAARVNGVRRVVFASSKSVYAPVTGRHAYPSFVPITEDWPKFDRQEDGYVPFYSTTNKMAEYMGIRMAMKYNLEFAILRFGPVWGPGKFAAQLKYRESESFTPAFVISKMIDDAIEGRPTFLPEGGHARDSDNFVYNKDVAQGVVKACLSEKARFDRNNREYHFDEGRVFSLGDFASALRLHFPAVSIEVRNRAVEHERHRPGTRAVFDLSRAREELGYEPEYADLHKAIADYISTERIFRRSVP